MLGNVVQSIVFFVVILLISARVSQLIVLIRKWVNSVSLIKKQSKRMDKKEEIWGGGDRDAINKVNY